MAPTITMLKNTKDRSVTVAALATILCLASVTATTANAAATKSTPIISCVATTGGADITVEVPAATSADYTINENEVVFKFSKNVGAVDLSSVASCSPLINNVQNSFNQILFSAASTATIAVDKGSPKIVIHLTAPEAAETESPAEKTALAITQARALYQTGDETQAFDILEQALTADPKNAELLQTLADYEHTAGRSQAALRLLEQANSANPQSSMSDRSVADTLSDSPLYQELSAPYRPTGHVGFEFLDGKSSYSERRYTASASTPISDQLPGDVVRLKMETNNASFQNIAAPNGNVVSPDFTRERYEGAYVHPFNQSSELSIIASGAAQTVGGGAQLTSADRGGVSEFALQAHEPNWDYASTAAFHGARDRAEATRVSRITQDIPFNVGLALNRFSLDGDSNAATSGDINAGIGYILLREPATVQLNYSLAGDYFIRHHDRGSDGDSYRTFPQESTEFHSFTVGASYPVTQIPGAPIVYGFAGYAFDRLGGTTPEVGGGVHYVQWRGPEASLEIGKSLSTVSESSSQVRVVGSLTWRF